MSEQQQSAIKCAIVIGIREDGGVFIETHGTDQNLITVEGLLGYGKRYVDNAWAEREIGKNSTEERPEAQTEAGEEVEVEVIPPVVEPKPKKRAPRKKKEEVVDVEVSE